MRWITVKFGDFVEVQPQILLQRGEVYPFISMEAVEPLSRSVESLEERIWDGGGGAKFQNGDTIFARITPCLEHGKTSLVKSLQKDAGFGSTEFFVFRSRPKISDSNFIYYLACTDIIRQPAIKSMIGASGRLRAQRAVIENIKISVPNSVNEQIKISSILTAYDDLIENNLRRIKLLEESARQLYKEWFVRFRFPGYEHTKIINGVPEGWEKKKLGDVYEVRKGKSITKEKTQEGEIPVVAGGLEPAYYHNEANARSPVVTISASGANSGFVNIYYEDIWASDCSYISSQSTDRVYYLYCHLKSKQPELSNLQKGAAQPHVYPKDIMDLNIVNPADRFIQNFIDVTTPSFSLIGKLRKQLKLLIVARDLLLPKLINGELEI